MAQSKPRSQPASRSHESVSAPVTISGRWLLAALAISIPAAAVCTWTVFCLLFWQGSWQLLYHPRFTVARNPSNIGLAYNPVSFATTESGVPQIQGWWIPAASAKYTALYLHDEAGNLGDTISSIASLHASGMNVLAFDYRGYGQSQFLHPSEARWKQDAMWALDYLTGSRHIDPHSIIVVGNGLGANLALEIAAARPDLAGIVLESPIDSPVDVVFNDARAKLVPAHLLVRDRYDLITPASALRIPSLWIVRNESDHKEIDLAFEKLAAPKTRTAYQAGRDTAEPLKLWLTGLRP